MCCSAVSVKPVSYTHLDVYKRQDYKLTPEALERAITPRTKWLMMNAPSNPTGSVYTADELRGLTAVLERHPHVWLMTDAIYARLNFTDAPTVHPLQVAPALAARTLVVNGVSKAYAMTGWRIGYGAGPDLSLIHI